MASFTQVRVDAMKHLKGNCPLMRRVIGQVGPCSLRLNRDRFGMLARSILYQQISGRAARSIHDKLLAALPAGRLEPEGLAKISDARYRSAGVSPQKMKYLRSLAELTLAGKVRLSRIGRYSDDEIIEQLTRVKGIGTWTAQMFLMFSLGRPDVLPWDDLGVRQAIRNLHGMEVLPTRADSERAAEVWRPYRTIASWYCWRSLEIEAPGG